jgi:hypothetical protein
MNVQLEKRLIIDELANVNDEWLLKAIKRLLAIDESDSISIGHQELLDSRIKSYDSGITKPIDWEDAKKKLPAKFP